MLTILTVTALLALSALLWWRLSGLQEQNEQLRAEVMRLRGKLRAMQP